MHSIPFSQDTGDTFVLAIIMPVSGLLLFFDTAQTETMNGMFRLQANDLIVEKTLWFQWYEFVPICIGHRVGIEKAIRTTSFDVNWDLRLISIF